MKKLLLWIKLSILIAGLAASFNSHANKPYLEKNRVAYIAKVLQAFSETPSQNIHNTYRYIGVIDANNCRSHLSDLRVECLLNFANKNCSELISTKSRANCELYSDIVIVNKLSEKTFIDRSERYRISKGSDYDFRTALEYRLKQKYAKIVAQFSFTNAAQCDNADFNCLAQELDQFCLDYTNSQNLSWQYCTSSMLWFIGTSNNN